MFGVMGRMCNMTEGHSPFEGKLCLISTAFHTSVATDEIKPDSILHFSVHFYQLSAAGTKKSKFHSV